MNIIAYKIKSNIIPFFVALILVSGCCAAWYYLHPASPYHKRMTFVVRFEKVGTLTPGNRVAVRGITKGEITKVKLTDEAVYVTAEVLADTKISRNSRFRLITAGLMGERELSVLTSDDGDYLSQGDTINGFFDEGTAGITQSLRDIMDGLGEIKEELYVLVDSVTVGASVKRVNAVGTNAKKIISTMQKLLNEWKASVATIMDNCDSAVVRAKDVLEDASLKGEDAVEAAQKFMPRIDSLLQKTKDFRGYVNAFSAQLESDSGSVGLILDEKSKMSTELDGIKTDFDALYKDLKEEGLKLNVDIF